MHTTGGFAVEGAEGSCCDGSGGVAHRPHGRTCIHERNTNRSAPSCGTSLSCTLSGPSRHVWRCCLGLPPLGRSAKTMEGYGTQTAGEEREKRTPAQPHSLAEPPSAMVSPPAFTEKDIVAALNCLLFSFSLLRYPKPKTRSCTIGIAALPSSGLVTTFSPISPMITPH